MDLEFILLGMLHQPASGYDLKCDFDAGPRYFWSAELSQIYPALQKMQRRGWLRSHRQASPHGPERRVYVRTAKGSRSLHAWLRGEPVIGTQRLAYIGQLIFMGELADRARTRVFLKRLRDRLNAMAELLESAERGLRAREATTPAQPLGHQFHELLCLRMGIASLRAKIAVCDEGLRLIRRQGPRRPGQRGGGK